MRIAYVLTLAVPLAACAQAYPHGSPRDGGARDGAATDTNAPSDDAYVPGNDAFAPGDDAYAPGNDAYVAPVDASVPVDAHGTRIYLDRCTAAADCASGLCAQDRGGTHFCTRTCTSDLQCAHEHVCVTTPTGGICFPDDTGVPCSVGTPEQCVMGLCLGSPAGGHCTRTCSSAAECPSGYACTRAGGSAQKICVDIEVPCSAAADCATGYCTTFGCTAACDSAADCPGRLAGFPAYACDTRLGPQLCIPPADIAGSDPTGAPCPATGTNSCRSDACDTSPALPFPMCVQACTAQGGCGPGLGCFPLVDTGTIQLVCERAGTGDLTTPCAHGSDCVSGLCDGTGAVCTRLCADGLCPTGYTCQPVPGFSVSLCRP